jgi:hypothetical protein
MLAGILAGTFWSVCVGLVILIFAATNVRHLRRKLGNVHFDGETVSIYCPTHRRTYAARLADCRWFVGNQTWATIPCRDNLVGIGTGKVLLIVFPDSVQTPAFYTGRRRHRTYHPAGPAIAAVGLTVETRFQWEQAIERLNVEKDSHREAFSPMSETFLTFWILFSLAAPWFPGVWISRAVHHLLTLWNVPADIVSGISVPSFILGVIYIFIFLMALPYFLWKQPSTDENERDELPGLERFRQEDIVAVPTKILPLLWYFLTAPALPPQWRAVIGLGSLHTFLIIAFWYFADGNNWTVFSAITATAFSVVIYAVFTAVAWCLLAKPREDDAVTVL